ncbi:MAG TPA: hypothetical protein VF604_12995 [Pyrinomonadaceae bacterium]|jgi:hypothetical protein
MKKFIVSILCAATFFIGLGGLIEGVGARFKSDERALELVRQARQAVGGEQSIAAVRSLTISGRVTKTFDFDGTAKSEQGDWEMNLQLPNQFSKTMKLRREGAGGEKFENVDKEVIVIRQSGELKERVMLPAEEGGEKKKAVFVMKNEGGEKVVVNGDGEKVQDRRIILYKDNKDGLVPPAAFHQNELFRTSLALLLTPPPGTDVSYKYAGEGSVDGANCDIVEASANGSSVRLYLDKTTHLVAMMTYQAPKPFIIKIRKEEGKANTNEDVKVVRENLRERMPAPELAEFQVKFSDYRTVGGVQLPYRWTQTIGGKDDETIEVTSYELNPADIADKFKESPNRVFFRTAKPQ